MNNSTTPLTEGQIEPAQQQKPPLGWYWAEYKDAEQWNGPLIDKESAIAHAVTSIDWSEDGEKDSCRTVYLVMARPKSLTDDIFSSDDVLDSWHTWNEDSANEYGDLDMDPTVEQRAELERELHKCFAAWRARHHLGRAWMLDVAEQFEETVYCPGQAAPDA